MEPPSNADDDTRASVSPNESTGGLPVESWELQTKRIDDVDSEPLPRPRPTPVAERLDEGSRIGRFMVLDRIGAGGMGVVWRAYDPRLGREVALKCLRSRGLQAELRDRLVREAQAMAKLSHPNVVSVYDVLEPAPGEVVLAMEYVPGVNLRRWLSQRERSWKEALRMLVEAGQGLAAAHAQGLLHRDFKPSNVLVGEDDRPRVTDFGLAKLEGGWEPASRSKHPFEEERSSLERSASDEDDPLTSTGAVLGTPAYMAPEQYGERGVDARADQYAFCSSLWHAITGVLPFAGAGSDLATIIEAKEQGPPPWPREHPLPRRLVAAITRGMAPRPEDRWPSMAALLDRLRWDPRARRRRWLAVGAAVVTVSASVVALLSFQAQRAERCSGAREALVGVWDGERHETARAAFTAAGVAYGEDAWRRLAPRLDEYASAWARMHREACEATSVRGEQSAEVLDLRMACLERARMDLRAASKRLVEADADVVERAHDLVDGLLPLSRCADIDALRTGVEPPAPEDAQAVRAAQEALAEARALAELGKLAAAETALAEAEAALGEAAYEPIRTELQRTRGVTAAQAGAHAKAEKALRDALQRAARWGQWDELQDAAFELLLVVGRSRGLDAEALRYAELARGLAERSGDPIEIGMVHVVVGIVHKGQGRLAEAEAETRAGLAVLEAGLPAEHAKIAQARGSLAAVLHLRGHSDEAAEQMRVVIEILETSLGELHPDVLSARNNLAVMLVSQRRHDEAEVELRAVVERRTALAGPGSEGVAKARDNLAHVLRARGRLAEAVAEHRAALQILQSVLGADHVDVARSHNNLGAALEAQGELEAAEAELRAAAATWERLRGADHPNTALAQHNLGLLLLQAQPQLAVEPLERAWAVRRTHAVTPLERARTAFALAQALEGSGSRTRARALAEQADAAYGEAGASYDGERSKVQAWLAEHGRGAPR